MQTVRGRSTALAVATVLLALIVGGVAMLIAFRSTLLGNLDSTLRQQANDRAQLLADGAEPSTLTGLQQEEAFVWIGSPDGTVFAVEGNYIPVENPMPDRLNSVGEVTLTVEEQKPTGVETETSAFRLASATTNDGALVVLTAAELEVVDKTVADLGTLFLIALPFVAGLVGLLTWTAVGAALAPVDNIRREAEGISGTAMSGRVPVPETEDEISDLAHTMNEMLDRLEAHRDSLRQFTSDASHELKSPVANMRALVETTSIDDPTWPPVRERLVSEGGRLQSLVENLLFLASHAEGSPTSRPTTVHLDDLLFDEVATVRASTQISVNIDAVEPASVQGSEGDLNRLIRNLLDNAAQHAAARVVVSLTQRDDRVVLTVADDGPGIDQEDRQRVFERFTRLDFARDRHSGGSGLGLSIVRQIVDDHGASVRIEDVDPTGAAFIVEFP